MSDIPTVNWPDFVKIVEAGRIQKLKSCEVKFDGTPIFTAEITHGDMYTDSYTRINAEQVAIRSNIPGGVDPEELLKELQDVVVDEFPNLTKARAARQAKRQKVGVGV